MNDLQGWAAILLGVAGVGGLLATLYKLRPESARIFVDSARVSVEMSDTLRDNLIDDMKDLRERMQVCEASRIAAELKNAHLEKVLREILKELHDEHGIDLHARLDPPPTPELPTPRGQS